MWALDMVYRLDDNNNKKEKQALNYMLLDKASKKTNLWAITHTSFLCDYTLKTKSILPLRKR